MKDSDWDQSNDVKAMCADPDRDVAMEACCMSGWETPSDYNGRRYCKYNNERMAYSRAQDRCSSSETPYNQTCEFASFDESENTHCSDLSIHLDFKYW